MSLETSDRVTMLRVAAHPVRLQILSLLTGAAMTATEVANELGITHANASYHLRKLLVLPAVVVEHEGGPGRGGSKRYRYDVNRETPAGQPRVRTDDEVDAQRGAYLVLAEELRRRVGLLSAESRAAQTDAELWVAPEEWEAVVDAVSQASLALHRAAQAPRSPGTIRVNATVALFRMTP